MVLAMSHARWVAKLAHPWDNSDAFKRGLVAREAEICALCGANFRMRVQASVALHTLGLPGVGALIEALRTRRELAIYETATRNVFRAQALESVANYVTSEYLDGAQPGSRVGGVLHQDLERLTFADESFDLVLTSEVLEHVADLGRALSEIQRVLKPGGSHVFTIPVDPELPAMRERARVVDGRIEHLEPPVMHGDSLREAGIIAFRDFGADTADRMTSAGLACREVKFTDASGRYISSVFVARKHG